MSEKIQTTQKHLDMDARVRIEKGLDASMSLRAIAMELHKDPSTIAKEIKKHRIFQEHNSFNVDPNKCANKKDCRKKHLCSGDTARCRSGCRTCPHCYKYCPDFVPFSYTCPLTEKAPYVCNGCKKRYCRLDKYYYRATTANRQYRTVLVGSRTGLNISEDELSLLDEAISPLIRQGQSPFMILQNHPEIRISEKTIYNYIASGALSVTNIDLPKKVKYKPRKSSDEKTDDMAIFEGRSYKDFTAYISTYPDTRVTEMDTVLGCEGSKKVLMTLHFCSCDFMMAFLMPSKEACEVERIFDSMEHAIGAYIFSRAMPLILTDRGGEFRHPDALECGTDNIIRTSIYYCDPMSSWQKPHCEKNHEYIRMICPKGKSSFDKLSQDDVNLMMSHINSACRESLGGLSPFALAKMMLPAELLEHFGLWEVPADEIILTPKLLAGKQLRNTRA